MKYFSTSLLILALAATAFSACDDDTWDVGTGTIPGNDTVTAQKDLFYVNTASVRVDSVVANTPRCYIGSIVDPETRARTSCDFLAQYAVMNSYRFPSRDRLVYKDGRPWSDSCQIRLVADSYFGDSLTVMKMSVQELDASRPMNEGTTYYSNLEPSDYVNGNSIFNLSHTYTVKDLTTSSGDKNITVNLNPEFGVRVIEKYLDHPEYFSSNYNFVRNVCPGFFFKTDGGVGSMMNIYASVIDLHFYYNVKDSLGNDSVVGAWQRMAATEEVIQNTRVQNTIPADMLSPDSAYTYVKSPTGIFTEAVLPVDEIFSGSHYSDTLNSAKITFPRINSNLASGSFKLDPPTTLLLIRKTDMARFFEESDVCDGKTSFIADYTSSYNAYVYPNIASLITRMKVDRDAGAGVSKNESEEVRKAKYATWEAANPDWNKVMLVPVNAEYSITTNSAGYTSKTLLRVRNELGLSSAKLVGGTQQLPIEVIYTRFNMN